MTSQIHHAPTPAPGEPVKQTSGYSFFTGDEDGNVVLGMTTFEVTEARKLAARILWICDKITGTQNGRVLTEPPRAQGFRSQEHLDAFFTAYDHQLSCPVCSREGKSYWNEADASWQPTQAQCPEGVRLFQLATEAGQR
jgi:hypothetical protein